MAALPLRLPADGVVVSGMDTTVRLPPDAPGRAFDCLICARPIGASLANQIVIWPAMSKGCHCGNLSVLAYLVHASCPMPNAARLIAMAVARQEIDHSAGDECW